MSRNATLKKIAEQLNLSISTVSRALKNHPDISETTKRKVKELATLIDYEPNLLAVQLRTQKSHILGLIVPSISNMFNDSFIAAAEKEARSRGYSLLILQSGEDPVCEVENLKLCKLLRVDGIFLSVVSETRCFDFYEKLREAGIPLIFFDRIPIQDNYNAFRPIHSVCMADEESAILAATTVLKYKKKNVLALFGNEKLSITQIRKHAFEKGIKKNKEKITLTIAHCTNTEEAYNVVFQACRSFQNPDLIFCMSDELLMGAMKSIQQLQLKIPEDLSVLAISNGIIPHLFHPVITYIETSGVELAKLAVSRMMELIEHPQAEEKSILLPARLVAGGSLR
ncbi:MAG: LacI family transcriptional regulator [Chitinophagaceae bacterium]|nr:LacI family transcriptional regulator [Chitinophagaceae bacterium]